MGTIISRLTAEELNAVAREAVDCAYHLHSRFAPGMREIFYANVLEDDLRSRGRKVEREKRISFEHNGRFYVNAFRADLLVDDELIIEVKATLDLPPGYYRQLLT